MTSKTGAFRDGRRTTPGVALPLDQHLALGVPPELADRGHPAHGPLRHPEGTIAHLGHGVVRFSHCCVAFSHHARPPRCAMGAAQALQKALATLTG